MWLLVPLARVKQALGVTTNDDDDLLSTLISAASRAIVAHLKRQAGDLLTIDSPPNSPPDDLDDVPEDISAAVILLTRAMYDPADEAWEEGELPKPVRALLRMHRDPTLA